MEAPEKIYISPNSEESTYYVSNQYNRLIEYVRKDAFIEKLETWLNKRHKRDRYTLIYFRKHFKNIINEIMKD